MESRWSLRMCEWLAIVAVSLPWENKVYFYSIDDAYACRREAICLREHTKCEHVHGNLLGQIAIMLSLF